MPETSPDNLAHEHEDQQQHASGEPEFSVPLPSRIPEEADSKTEGGEEHGAEPSAQELREAVFPKATPSSAGSEAQPESEPVSLWQRIKHSALYGNKQKAAAASSSVDRSSRRQNKTGLLAGGLLAAFAAGVWLFCIVPVRKPPAQNPANAQQPAATTEKSLTPGLEAHPNQQQPSGDQTVTAADIRATANGTPPPPVTSKKTGNAEDPDYALGKIPPPAAPLPAAASAPPPPVAPQKNPLDTPSLVFVRHPANEAMGKTNASVEPVSFQSALALQSQAFDSLSTGTRLVARLETPVSTAVSLPAVATVEYNYEDRDHRLVIPAGTRVFGTLEQADSQGFVGLHFQSMQRLSDPAPLPFEARAIGLDYKPLKGVVTGRNRSRRFLVRAASGIGEMTAATVGMNRGTGAGDALNNNVLIREQVMNNVGSAGDQGIQQMAYSEHPVVTLPGNTRFYLVVDHEAKQRERRDGQSQQAVDGNTNNPGIQAQLVELRKELADLTAKQTPMASQPVAAEPSDTVGLPAAATPTLSPQ